MVLTILETWPYGANHGWRHYHVTVSLGGCWDAWGLFEALAALKMHLCIFPLSFILSLLSHCERRHQGRFHANMLFGNDVIPMGSSVLSDGRRRRKGERLSLILASSNIIMKCHNPVVRLPKNTGSLHFPVYAQQSPHHAVVKMEDFLQPCLYAASERCNTTNWNGPIIINKYVYTANTQTVFMYLKEPSAQQQELWIGKQNLFTTDWLTSV